MLTDLRILLLILTAFPAILVAATMPSSLTVNTELSKEGFVTLYWDVQQDTQNNATPASLQISRDAAFTHRLRELRLPQQNKVHLSGFENGLYYARLVGEQRQPLSAMIQFRVQHHSLKNAFLLFGIGLLLFILLLACLLQFTRKHAQRP